MDSRSVWIGVGIGVLGSLFAAYLKPWLDRLGGGISLRWGERTAAKAAARTALIAQLRANPHEQVMMGLDAFDDKIDGIWIVGLGFGLSLLATRPGTWLGWLGLLVFAAGAFMMGRGDAKRFLLKEVRSPQGKIP